MIEYLRKNRTHVPVTTEPFLATHKKVTSKSLRFCHLIKNQVGFFLTDREEIKTAQF
jgi:hypothetical protein